LLVDATYQPVNALKGKKRDHVILRDLINLVEDLKKVSAGKNIPIILVKSNICTILETRLKQQGFTVQNNGVVVPFPSTGQQKRFHEKLSRFHQALKIHNSAP